MSHELLVVVIVELKSMEAVAPVHKKWVRLLQPVKSLVQGKQIIGWGVDLQLHVIQFDAPMRIGEASPFMSGIWYHVSQFTQDLTARSMSHRPRGLIQSWGTLELFHEDAGRNRSCDL